MKLLATISLILCVILLVGIAITDHQQLPDKIASQFDGNGAPTGWMSKSSFTWLMIAVGLGIPAFVIGIMYTIRFIPAKFLNVPNPTYWRDPKHHKKACDFLFVASLWFGNAFLIWHILSSHMVVAANQISPPHLDSGRVILLSILLLVFTFGWTIALVIRFLKTDNE